MDIKDILRRMDATVTTDTIRVPVSDEEARDRVNKGLPPKEASSHIRAVVTNITTKAVMAVADHPDTTAAKALAVAKAAKASGTPIEAPDRQDPTMARVVDLERRVAELESQVASLTTQLDAEPEQGDTLMAAGHAKPTARSKGGQKTPIGAGS